LHFYKCRAYTSQYLDVFAGWTIAVRFQAGAEIISSLPPHPNWLWDSLGLVPSSHQRL